MGWLTDPIDWWITPFTDNPFLRDALWAALLTVLCTSVIGTWVVLRGLSFLGDALAHGVLPGIAIAFVLGGNTTVGALLAALAMVAGVQVIRTASPLPDDASIGVLFVGFLALAVVVMSAQTGRGAGDLTRFLFGSINAVDATDLRLLVVVAAITVGSVTVLHRALLVSTFDITQARLIGFRPQLTHFALLVLLALSIVASFETVGSLLVFAFSDRTTGDGFAARHTGAADDGRRRGDRQRVRSDRHPHQLSPRHGDRSHDGARDGDRVRHRPAHAECATTRSPLTSGAWPRTSRPASFDTAAMCRSAPRPCRPAPRSRRRRRGAPSTRSGPGHTPRRHRRPRRRPAHEDATLASSDSNGSHRAAERFHTTGDRPPATNARADADPRSPDPTLRRGPSHPSVLRPGSGQARSGRTVVELKPLLDDRSGAQHQQELAATRFDLGRHLQVRVEP